MATARPAALHCPRCINAKMELREWNRVWLHICMACGANYFPAGELAKWEGWSADIPAAIERVALRGPSAVMCPACSATMERVRFATTPPLSVERCRDCHGILLDYEEIRAFSELGKWAAAWTKSAPPTGRRGSPRGTPGEGRDPRGRGTS